MLICQKTNNPEFYAYYTVAYIIQETLPTIIKKKFKSKQLCSENKFHVKANLVKLSTPSNNCIIPCFTQTISNKLILHVSQP